MLFQPFLHMLILCFDFLSLFCVLVGQPGEEMATLGAEQLCDERVYPSKLWVVVVEWWNLSSIHDKQLSETVELFSFCDISDLSWTVTSVIASKSQESDFDSVAKNVSQQVAEYNKILIDSLQNNRN